VLGVRDVALLDYRRSTARSRGRARGGVVGIASHLRRVPPQVVLTFGPDGAYGHPDHVAISALTTAAAVAAADRVVRGPGLAGLAPHAISKLYYLAWPQSTWAAYEAAFKKLASVVDGVERQASPWPEWAITTMLDTRELSRRSPGAPSRATTRRSPPTASSRAAGSPS
jgi:LmbE family N-acetylglucosaminyl deacetylase